MLEHNILKAYTGEATPTIVGVLRRIGIPPSAAAKWAEIEGMVIRDQTAGTNIALDDEEGSEGSEDIGMGTGNEVLLYGPILGDGFERRIYDMEGWIYVTAAMVKKRLAEIDGDVVLRINSPGGLTTEMAAIATALTERKKAGSQVDAIIDGMAASAAGILFLLCSNREMTEFAQLMLHRAWGCILICGNHMDIRNGSAGILSSLEEFDSTQIALIARVTGQGIDWVTDTLDKEIWYGRDSAVGAKLATGAYPKPEDATKAAVDTPDVSVATSTAMQQDPIVALRRALHIMEA